MVLRHRRRLKKFATTFDFEAAKRIYQGLFTFNLRDLLAPEGRHS